MTLLYLLKDYFYYLAAYSDSVNIDTRRERLWENVYLAPGQVETRAFAWSSNCFTPVDSRGKSSSSADVGV